MREISEARRRACARVWTRRCALVAAGGLALLLAAGASACSDSGSGANATPTGPVPGITSQIISDATPLPPPVVQGNKYLSTFLKYSIQFPDGWKADQGIVRTPSITTDVFLGPASDDGVTPNVSVTCDRSYKDGTAFDNAKRQFADQFAKGQVTENQVTAGGVAGLGLAYDQTTGNVTVHKSETHLFTPACAWSITLTEHEGKDYSNVYDNMLKSFAFVS